MCKYFILTKYLQMPSKKSPKIPKIFYCKQCDYNTSNKKDYNKHLSTDKHQILTNTYKNPQKSPKIPKNEEHVCECGKLYKHRQSLYYHKKACVFINEKQKLVIRDDVDYRELMMKAMEQMMVQQEDIKGLQNELVNECNKKDEMMTHMIDKIGNTTNNNNINFNMFLNEQCKNAVNFSDFIESIEVSQRDLENNAQLGFVNGMTKILMDNLKQLTLYERPIHCTDVKREVMYIKDTNRWDKEGSNKKLEDAILNVSRKSIGSLLEWKKTNPEYQNMDSDFSKQCIHIQKQSIASTKKEILYPKIIHNIAKENSISQKDLRIKN